MKNRILLAGGCAFVLSLAAGPVHAQTKPAAKSLLAAVTEQQRAEISAYWKAQSERDAELARYWREVDERRSIRRKKRAGGEPFVAADYVADHPPEDKRPKPSPALSKMLAELAPRPTEVPLPAVADFLAYAKSAFGFVPEKVAEDEFKRRFAREALRVGLSKEQMVGIYALETGGRGDHDMQAGFDPTTKKGRPISSALGYAQLLHANSVNELANHGAEIVARVREIAAAEPRGSERAKRMDAKIAILQDMVGIVGLIPNRWEEHMRFARSTYGGGIHAINLDADIGPVLQTIKLRGLLRTATRAGLAAPTSAQLELMNLAGPATAIEMMTPVGATMPTSNFFERSGYERNSIVRGRTGAELLKRIEDVIANNLKNPGAQRFLEIFDKVPY